jgi:glutamyl-tRNA reductase
VLVVGAGEVARVAVTRAVRAGADVTVANRTLRRAERLRDAGASVVDLAELDRWLAVADVAVLATAAPHPLVDAASVAATRAGTARPLLLVDLSMPRNVHPSVRELDGVELLDLQDLQGVTSSGPGSLVRDVDVAERLVREEVTRYLRWLDTRTAGDRIQRLRADADSVAREEAERVAGRLPEHLQGVVEEALLRTARRLAHGPTTTLLAAAQRGDDELVTLLSGIFGGPNPRARAADATDHLADAS